MPGARPTTICGRPAHFDKVSGKWVVELKPTEVANPEYKYLFFRSKANAKGYLGC